MIRHHVAAAEGVTRGRSLFLSRTPATALQKQSQPAKTDPQGKNWASIFGSTVTSKTDGPIIGRTDFLFRLKKLPADLSQNGPESSLSALRRLTQPDRFMPMTDRQPELMLSVRVPADLREALARAAEQEHRTLSGQVRHIIARAVEQQRPATA
jgi:CopG-like RHH_1 or ribbon-helix-helix domain, RHH_5